MTLIQNADALYGVSHPQVMISSSKESRYCFLILIYTFLKLHPHYIDIAIKWKLMITPAKTLEHKDMLFTGTKSNLIFELD